MKLYLLVQDSGRERTVDQVGDTKFEFDVKLKLWLDLLGVSKIFCFWFKFLTAVIFFNF